MHIKTACELFGRCRQAYYQLKTNYLDRKVLENRLVEAARDIRTEVPGVGAVKLHNLLSDIFSPDEMIGRDAFIKLLDKHSMMLAPRKTKRTTNSNHSFKKYQNLIKGSEPFVPNGLWVSDITYISTQDGFSYLHLVTDAYSRRIMGWSFSDSLKAIHSLEALKMAIDYTQQTSLKGLIHHSDRGKQYCCHEYTQMLKKYDIEISMTQDSKPTDNTIAERVNGIIKQELIYRLEKVEDQEILGDRLALFIEYYNKRRPHMSLNMQTPDIAHEQKGEQIRLWKTKDYTENKKAIVES